MPFLKLENVDINIKITDIDLTPLRNISTIENNFLSILNGDSIPPTKIYGNKSLSFKFNIDSSGYLLKTINVYSENMPI
ncbi:MAG: hypothetical protein ACKPKO_48540, partial [Candidatus Fonsibacter sp.]